MARIKLTSWEATGDHLPKVCMVCGEPATEQVPRTFAWRPDWLGILAFLVCLFGTPLLIVVVILYFALAKRMHVEVPTCVQHASYWKTRALWMYGPLVGLLVLATAEIAILVAGTPDNVKDGLTIFLVFSLIAFIVWMIVVAIWQQRILRPTEITDNCITLVKVHEEFARALKESRTDEGDDFDDEPRRGRSASGQHREARNEGFRDKPPRRRPVDDE